MMSKKQLGCMLTLHIIYLLLGASIFYHIESPVEMAQRADEKLERLEIQNLLYENYIPTDPEKQDSILSKLSAYCGKSMFNYTTEDHDPPIKWDFYHSFFFSYTVVSTIGYGNLAPTTHLSRILMIFYGLFGIPINGILLANLGEYFGLQLITVYRRYKKRDGRRADMLDYFFLNLGMLGQIFIYLVPGFLFFIFLPACLFVLFEGWDYVGAVYYAFVTLTTIGFGDLVAGTVNNGFAGTYFMLYKLFLIVWITFGLGYIVMLLGFITSGMRSEGVHKIEQKIASQWRSTQNKILHGFTRDINVIRKLINEANLIKLKPVYVETAPFLYRSKSCPVLSFDVEPRGPIYNRKRANSENIHLSTRDLLRIQSDTDLLGIDKERTFTSSAMVRPADLLARVVNVLGGLDHEDKGVHMFDDDEILSSEKPTSWSIGQNAITAQNRTRALSVAVPNYRKDSVDKSEPDVPWPNGDSKDAIYKRAGKLSLPTAHLTSPIIPENVKQPKSILSKIFQKQSSFDSPAECIKNTMKYRIGQPQEQAEEPKQRRRGSILQTFFGGDDRSDAAKYKEKTKRGRGSIFPTFDNQEEDDNMAKAYKEKTSRGRHSIFPTFDFSEEEDAATAKAYRQKSKRHSIFPTFDFTEDESDEEEKTAKAYREKTRSGRHSIFPTFDFSESEEDTARKYKEKTKQGRRGSIFPTFDFGGSKDDGEEDDTIDEDEVRKYQSRTQRGRLSLFPTFGKSKKSAPEPDDTVDEMSEELQSYQNKTRKGRGSLFPTFGKARKSSISEDGPSDLEASIKQYQNQSKRGRGSLFSSDSQKKDDEETEVLEQTSVADLLRALAVLEGANPNAKRGSIDTSGLLSALTGDLPSAGPPATRRRGSIHPDFVIPNIPSFVNKSEGGDGGGTRRRRVSARAAAPQFTPTLATVVAGAELQTTAAAARENRMNILSGAVPEGGEEPEESEPAPGRTRRFSPAPPTGPRSSTAPVSRRFSRIRKESVASIEEESDSRRGSLTDIVIDNNKDNT